MELFNSSLIPDRLFPTGENNPQPVTSVLGPLLRWPCLLHFSRFFGAWFHSVLGLAAPQNVWLECVGPWGEALLPGPV